MWSSSRIAGALLALVFISMVVVPIVEAACPHNCSGHGICSHNACTCNAGYTGSDCSMSIIPLQSGQIQEDSLNTFTWRYYSIVVPVGASALNITVRQTNMWGDVDSYVSRGTLPTFTDYIARDISTNKNYELSISPAPPGTYYIGQYAYFHVEYTIQADVIVSCALECGEHGSCVGESCQCNPNWSGDICDVYDEQLVSGQTAHNTVQDQQWMYYHINVNARQTMFIHVEQFASANQNCDVDVYVKKDQFPSMFDFNYANATINPITELSLRDPGAGTWYIGVYGYRGCAFSITVTISEVQGCLSECSRHGTCFGSVCSCTPGYNGDSCENKEALIQLGVPETGYVGRTDWNYYKLQANTANSVLVAVAQELSTADCDLFVKRDSKPTNFDFDYSNLSFEQFFNVTINDPSTATWYIGVYGWTDCGYTLTASIPTTCACAEPYHGRCAPNSAQCICDNGWSGDHCDQQENLMHNNEVYSDTVTLNSWQYYRITAESSAMLISMKESETVGRLWLFASLNGYPSLDAYAKSDISTKSEFHEVHFVFEERDHRVFYIGVFGSPFSPTEVEMPYNITAWYPPF